MSAPDRTPATGSTRGSSAAYGAMSEAVQNWPLGVTPMPGSPSSLRCSPRPGAGGSAAPPVHLVSVGLGVAAASPADSGATTSSAAPAASRRRCGNERSMTGISFDRTAGPAKGLTRQASNSSLSGQSDQTGESERNS